MSFTPNRIGLMAMFWVISLLAAGMGAFSVFGLPLAAIVILLWYVRARTRRIWSCIFLFYAILLIPTALPPTKKVYRHDCAGRLTKIGTAILNYRADKGHWPPAYVADENGVPEHSWRVLILEYTNRKDLFDRYRFDKPWDSPFNQKLVNQMPSFYGCTNHTTRPGHTRFSEVIGPNTVWKSDGEFEPGRTLFGFRFPLTAMVCESFEEIPWTKPTDFSAEDLISSFEQNAGRVAAGGHKDETFWAERPHSIPVLYSNGAVSPLAIPDDIEHFREATHDHVDEIQPRIHEFRWKWGRIVSLICFTAISVAPSWFMKNSDPESQQRESQLSPTHNPSLPRQY